MYIVEKEYSKEFTQECRAEFGLEPMQIRKIIATLSINNALDVDSLIQNNEQLKAALHESSVMMSRMSGVREVRGF